MTKKEKVVHGKEGNCPPPPYPREHLFPHTRGQPHGGDKTSSLVGKQTVDGKMDFSKRLLETLEWVKLKKRERKVVNQNGRTPNLLQRKGGQREAEK